MTRLRIGRSALSVCGLISAAAVVLSCASGTDNVNDPGGTDCKIPSSVPSNAKVVLIKDFAFNPAQVSVGRSGIVAWVNCAPAGSESHTSTSDAALWESPSIQPGAAFTRVFDAAPGTTFDYHCVPHPFMKGSVQIL